MVCMPRLRSSVPTPAPLLAKEGTKGWLPWRPSSKILPSPWGEGGRRGDPRLKSRPLPRAEGGRPCDPHLKSCPLPRGEGGPPATIFLAQPSPSGRGWPASDHLLGSALSLGERVARQGRVRGLFPAPQSRLPFLAYRMKMRRGGQVGIAGQIIFRPAGWRSRPREAIRGRADL